MPTDNQKHTEHVKVWLNERELVDLSRIANREDRKLSELVRVIVRRFMYGSIGSDCDCGNVPNSSDAGRSQ